MVTGHRGQLLLLYPLQLPGPMLLQHLLLQVPVNQVVEVVVRASVQQARWLCSQSVGGLGPLPDMSSLALNGRHVVFFCLCGF